MLLGVFLFDDLTQYNQYLGPIFFWSFVMLVYFAVLAAFIAFILDAFTKAKRKAAKATGQQQQQSTTK